MAGGGPACCLFGLCREPRPTRGHRLPTPKAGLSHVCVIDGAKGGLGRRQQGTLWSVRGWPAVLGGPPQFREGWRGGLSAGSAGIFS